MEKALSQESVLEDIKAETGALREDEEPHLCDYSHFRNEGIDVALAVIEMLHGL